MPTQADLALAALGQQPGATPSATPSAPAAPMSQADRALAALGTQAAVQPRGVMDQLGDAADAAQHWFMKPLHGGAQFVENLVAAGADKLPDNPVSRYIAQTAASDNQALANEERAYQARTPDGIAANVGAVAGSAAPLLLSGPAKVLSSIGGAVGDTLAGLSPQVAAKVVQAVGSGAAQGSAVGALNPVTGGGDYWGQKGSDIGYGALLGGAIPAAGTALVGAWNAGKGAVAPLVNPESVVAPFASKLVGEDPATLDALRNAPELVPGSRPTTAQILQTPQAVATEKAFGNTGDFKVAFADRMNKNNAARIDALQGIARTPEDMEAALQARAAAAAPMIDSITPSASSIPVWRQNLIDAHDSIQGVLDKSPRMSSSDFDAMQQAATWVRSAQLGNMDAPTLYQNLASLDVRGNTALNTLANAGASLRQMGNLVDAAPILKQLGALQQSSLGTNPAVKSGVSALARDIGEGIEFTNEGGTLIRPDLLDGYRQNVRKIITSAAADPSVVGSKEEAAFIPVRDAIVDQIEQTNPGYRAYLEDYAKNSVPINTMEAATKILGRVDGLGSLSNTAGDSQVTLGKLSSAIQAALKNSQNIDPAAKASLEAIQQDLQRESVSRGLTSPGSDTAYNLQAPNWLAGKIYGSNMTGTPMAAKVAGGALGALGGALTGGSGAAIAGGGVAGTAAASKLAQLGQNRVNTVMQNVLLDPQFAAALAEKANAVQNSAKFSWSRPLQLGTAASVDALDHKQQAAYTADIGHAQSIDDAIAAAGAATSGPRQFSGSFGPDGTYRLTGDPAEIAPHLRAAGIPGVPMSNGYMIGRSQAPDAARLFGQ